MITRLVITGFATLLGTILAGTARWPFQKCSDTARTAVQSACFGMFVFVLVMAPILLAGN